MWNPYTLISNDAECSCADNSIIDLFDGETKSVFNDVDFWWAKEIFRIKLKKYGDCLLRIGQEQTNLYYIKTEEEIKKEQEKNANKEKPWIRHLACSYIIDLNIDVDKLLE